jgi:methionyl-tRNA formyltransferase
VPTTESSLSTPGSIIRIDDQGLYVVCGDQKVLKVIYLQIPGKKVIHVKDLIHGRHCFKIGKSFTY